MEIMIESIRLIGYKTSKLYPKELRLVKYCDFETGEEWTAFVEAVIQDIATKKRWLDTGLIANIFIKEEWWDRLLELVKKSPDLNTIDYYEKYLSKHYANEIVELYATGVLKYMKNSMGRDHYQDACRYIRKIIKLGARDKANEIISYLRTEYPKRKALMEELDKV
jgi:transposase